MVKREAQRTRLADAVDAPFYRWGLTFSDIRLERAEPGQKVIKRQHSDAQPGSPCKRLAMIYTHFYEAVCSEHEQKEVSPDWGHA